MKILVTAKRVIDPYSKPSLTSDGRIDDDDLDFKMNPFCEIAVEEALRIGESSDDEVEVVAVAIGEDEATKEIRTALAMGAHRGILVEYDESELDSDLVAKMLQKIVAEEEPDLVLMGKQAVDGDSNQVAQLLAEYLGWPQATFAYKVSVDGDTATVQREVDGGVETVEMSLPAVITTDLRLNEPRYASLPGIMKAKRKPLDTKDPEDDLEVELDLKVELVDLAKPAQRQAGALVPDVDTLIDKLANEAKVI
ncbi:MAG: electron transfer flavoprotein subunit beta/FixA family protein [Myxococcales bacterium]|nr:electron transfer flavoprotein subunit beta/FixA family protein [Myxococcales bacterium]